LGGLADIEVASWVVTVTTDAMPDPVTSLQMTTTKPAKTESHRQVFDPGTRRTIAHRLYERNELTNGLMIKGPAIIVEQETSTVISPSFNAQLNQFGDIELTRETLSS